MTNANVDTVMQGVTGRTLKLSYKGGSKDVLVPENVPVVTPISAARSDLMVGKMGVVQKAAFLGDTGERKPPARE